MTLRRKSTIFSQNLKLLPAIFGTSIRQFLPLETSSPAMLAFTLISPGRENHAIKIAGQGHKQAYKKGRSNVLFYP